MRSFRGWTRTWQARLLPIPLVAAVAASAGALGVSNASAAAAPTVSARTAVLINLNTGEVLYDKNRNQRHRMASTAKMMTALLAAELSRPEEVATAYSHNFVLGSKVGIRLNERLSMGDLLHATLISSDNVAATVIGDHVGRTRLNGGADGRAEFVARMNVRAGQLGMRNTRFGNPFGDTLSTTYSSAADLALLGQAVLKNPLLASIVRTSTYRAVGTRSNGEKLVHDLERTNAGLCTYPGTYGVKGGYTNSSGSIGVDAVRRGNTSLMVVVMGEPTREARFADSAKLFNYGFAKVGETGGARGTCEETAGTVSYSGSWNRVHHLSYSGDFTKAAGSAGARATFRFHGNGVTWVAPKNTFRGKAAVYLDGKKVATVDLYAPVYHPRHGVYHVTGLASGFHELQVRVLGTKNPAATGTQVDIDAFRVAVAARR